MKRILHFDSADFVGNSNNNEPVLTVDHGFEVKKCKGATLKLSGYNIPNSFFQVLSTLSNNTFVLNEDDGNAALNLTITSGWYTWASLVTELSTVINAALVTSAAVTVSYNQINGHLTFTSDGVTDIALNLAGNQGFADLIGFPAANTGFANSHESTNPINLLPRKYMFLKCDELKTLQGGYETKVSTSNDEEKVLYKIDTVGDFGDVNVLRENVSGKYGNMIEGSVPKFIKLQCYDRDRNLIDFNNHPWSVDFEIEYHYS